MLMGLHLLLLPYNLDIYVFGEARLVLTIVFICYDYATPNEFVFCTDEFAFGTEHSLHI